MFEHFLTDLLKIVIVLDVLGVVAYFLLGVLKPKSGVEPANPALSELASPPVPLGGLAAAEAGKFGQLRSRLATAVSKLLPGRLCALEPGPPQLWRGPDLSSAWNPGYLIDLPHLSQP